LVRKFIVADKSCLMIQSAARVRPDSHFVRYAWTLAKETDSCLVAVHTHPFSDNGVCFSNIDDISDDESLPEAAKHLARGPHATIVLGRNSIAARWYDAKSDLLKPIKAIKILGTKLTTIVPTNYRNLHPEAAKHSEVLQEIHNRQILVFGEQGQKALQQMTVGIVGLGGIGSWVLDLLVRLGVGQIVIIDDDVVEKSNLNRLIASTLKDAKNKTPKVQMLADYAAEINPRAKITATQKSILEEDAQQQLKPCEVIFGCTDNQSSRSVLNSFCIERFIPFIDTGTGIQARPDHTIEHAGGQVRIVIPGMGCLNCINGINLRVAQQEMLPEPERQIAIQRGYIAGADVPAPAVGSLNGVIASLAVTEFKALVTGFKPLQRYVFYDFLNAIVVPCKFEKDPACFTCSLAGSLGIGDKGKPLPIDMLLDEPELQPQLIGGLKMERQNTNTKQLIANLLATSSKQGFDIEGSAEGQWFLTKSVKLSKEFNRAKTSILVKFIDDSTDPIILVPEQLEINPDASICGNFLATIPYIKGWKPLCPHMFQDIGDELLAFVGCLTGFLANPALCGLMGCEGRALAQRQQ